MKEEGKTRAQLVNELQVMRQRITELETLQRTSLLLTSSLDLSTVLESIAESALALVGASDCLIYLYDGASERFSFGTALGKQSAKGGVRAPRRHGLTATVVREGRPVVINDAVGHPLYASPEAQQWSIQAVAGFPLQRAGRVVGVLHVVFSEPHTFCEDDLRVLSLLADQAATAIDNSQLYAKAQQEIAERVRTEEALRRLQALNEGIVQNTAEGIVVDDASGIFSFVNPAAAALLGYEVEELVGQHYMLVIPPDQRFVAQAANERRARGQADRYEIQLVRKDGTRVPVQVSGSPRFDANTGQFAGTLAVFVDLAERMRVEEELRKHRDHLEELVNERTAALREANARLQREIGERERAEAELRKYHERLEELVEERTAELRKSEERYRTLFDGVPVGIYRTTPAGQTVDANLAQVQMLGYPSREDLLAVNVVDLYVHPEDRTRLRELVERQEVLRDFEAQLHRHDGAVIWASLTLRAVKDEQGQVLHYEGSLEDITERKQAEEELRRYQERLEELVQERTAELRKSEERYRTLFDGVPVGLYRTTPTGQVVDVNLAAVQMLGFPTKEATLASNTADLYVNPEGHARWKALMEREGVVRDFEYQIRRPDGQVIWISDTARTVRDERGQVLHYEGSLEDIAKRKRLEEESRRQKDYFEALFVNSPVAVVTVDLDANVVAWNPAAEKLFGYTQNEAIGKNVDDLVANDPSIREEALSYTTQAIMLGRVQATTKRTRKDGSLVDVEVLSMPVIVAGEEVGFIAMYPDIGELEQARREAEAANQAKSTFLANMSHELRTPLNAILGFTQLMGGDPNLTADQRENLEIINQSGEHLLVLINDVLEMSKIEAGRVTLQEKSFDLHRLLGGLEEMFGLRAEEKGLALRFERAEAVPQYVRTDEGKLRQVLSNLLGNAIKFTQEGSVTLGVSSTEYRVESEDDSLPLLPASRPYSLLHFQVQDTGPGIAPEDLEAVFDPFVQASSGQRSQEGTGLGLSISREYARLLGGDVTVSSELGQGSVFAFDVRVGLIPDGTAEAQAAQPIRQVVGLEPDQPTYRLLVAEDREANRRLLVKLLGELGPPPLGFEVREATNGREVIEIWERWEPHLIWMDLRMPVVDGYEAIRRIKATDRGQDTIIIALTASAFEEDRERVLTEGCDDFVRKPFRKGEIYDVLAKHLGVRFVYQESGDRGLRIGEREEGKGAQALSLTTMSAEWLADLQQATIKANSNQILALVDGIREQNPALADALAELVHDFEYKTILTLIEQAGG